eukprot:1157096-Pelagomonas_calceolata.AAC.6
MSKDGMISLLSQLLYKFRIPGTARRRPSKSRRLALSHVKQSISFGSDFTDFYQDGPSPWFAQEAVFSPSRHTSIDDVLKYCRH